MVLCNNEIILIVTNFNNSNNNFGFGIIQPEYFRVRSLPQEYLESQWGFEKPMEEAGAAFLNEA